MHVCVCVCVCVRACVRARTVLRYVSELFGSEVAFLPAGWSNKRHPFAVVAIVNDVGSLDDNV